MPALGRHPQTGAAAGCHRTALTTLVRDPLGTECGTGSGATPQLRDSLPALERDLRRLGTVPGLREPPGQASIQNRLSRLLEVGRQARTVAPPGRDHRRGTRFPASPGGPSTLGLSRHVGRSSSVRRPAPSQERYPVRGNGDTVKRRDPSVPQKPLGLAPTNAFAQPGADHRTVKERPMRPRNICTLTRPYLPQSPEIVPPARPVRRRLRHIPCPPASPSGNQSQSHHRVESDASKRGHAASLVVAIAHRYPECACQFPHLARSGRFGTGASSQPRPADPVHQTLRPDQRTPCDEADSPSTSVLRGISKSGSGAIGGGRAQPKLAVSEAASAAQIGGRLGLARWV
jgi:hypothetical protein